MTVDGWYDARKGQSLLVPGAPADDKGQCMQAADYALNEVYGLPYIWTEGAIDWWTKFDTFPQLKNNFVQVSDGSVKKGDFVIFNQKVGSIYGHISLAMQDATTTYFESADSNWGGNKTVHLVTHSGAEYVQGTLRPKGVEMLDASHQATLFVAYLGRLPTQGEVDRDVGHITTDTMINNLDTSTEYRDKKQRDDAAYAALANSNFVIYNGVQLYTKKA